MPNPRTIAGKPTMKDVARRAGVSGMTVSRVINGGDQVSEARRLAVHQAAAELGYSLNRAAQALALAKGESEGKSEPGEAEPFGQDAIDNSMHLASIALRLGCALFRAFATSEVISGKELITQLEREGLDGAHATTLLLRSAFVMHSKDASLFLTAQGAKFRHKAIVAILASASIMDSFDMRQSWPDADRRRHTMSPLPTETLARPSRAPSTQKVGRTSRQPASC